ncbi:hypothetical protein BACCIP111895_04729 [Neobacillus rhizosphaerae]|uniref:Uncharacterized protein n=2 Tax=Neobacillus rhizosphaerae TaxID=2880965 RepID=A0ABM9EZ94_9BACI|nr:hypothetical protein BACCIP111895_04729 [Neobacillus rhizosphaerae]
MGMKRGRKKYATTWQKKVYFIDRSPLPVRFSDLPVTFRFLPVNALPDHPPKQAKSQATSLAQVTISYQS